MVSGPASLVQALSMSRPRSDRCDAGQWTYVAHEPGKWTVVRVDHQARDCGRPARKEGPVLAETARATANTVSHSSTLTVHCRDAQRRFCPA
jgi:hypothetical protein